MSKVIYSILIVDFHILCFWKEIVPLRKVCRRPETDYRLQQLHAVNDAAAVDQQKNGMDTASVHGMRVTSSSETVPKQQIANIHIVTPVLQTNVSIPSQSMNVDPKKAEATADVLAGNSVTPSSAPFTSISTTTTTSSVPEVSTQNLAEGK